MHKIILCASGGCLKRQFKKNSSAYTVVDIEEDNRKAGSDYSMFSRAVNSNTHSVIHVMCGGLMESAQSSEAPEFFLHHAYIDKLWNDWQKKDVARVFGVHPGVNTAAVIPAADGSATLGDVADLNSMNYDRSTGGSTAGVSVIEKIISYFYI